MEFHYEPTPKDQHTLEYLASSKKERKGLESPTRAAALKLWRDGILEAGWSRSERSGIWRRRFFLPDDIRNQIENGTIVVKVSANYSDILSSASRLWEMGKVDYFDKWYSTRGSESIPSETIHRRVAVVSD